MNQAEFDLVVQDTIANIQKLLVVKGGEYAGSADRLANFKRGAALTGCTPLQVLFIYMSKHYDSVSTYIRKDASGESGLNQMLSEPIEGRLDDIINYCLLAKAIIKEMWDANKTSVDVGNPGVDRGGVRSGPVSPDAFGEAVLQAIQLPGQPGVDPVVHPPVNR